MILTEDINYKIDSLGILVGVQMHRNGDERFEELILEIERIMEEEPEIGATVGSILLENWSDGRIEKFFNSKTEDSVGDYADRVVKYYKKCHWAVYKVETGDAEAWGYILDKLRRWAYSFIKKKSLPFHVDLYQVATDCAHDAGARLMNIRFPFDVHYESWACRVVQNICYNYIRQHADKVEYVDLDSDLSETVEWLRDMNLPDGLDRAEKRMDLMEAVSQLNSEDRRRFIILYYFQGKSFKQISQILDRTPNAIYKLHFDSLENLRKIFSANGDNIGKDEQQ
jgi:RNA polymerase sigma factor (sigma-70 family)